MDRETKLRRQAERQRAYATRHRARVNARKVAALEANPKARERAREIRRQWALNNPERARLNARMSNANRRARLRKAGGRLSKDILGQLMARQRGRCACCKADLKVTGIHLDHVIAIASGGQNDDSNVQLLCPQCNGRKQDMHPIDFMQRQGYLL